MVTLRIASYDQDGVYREFSVGKLEMERAFDLLNRLVRGGCVLISVYYSADSANWIPLPIEAFDGEPTQEPLRTLQREWQEILVEK